LSIRDWPKNERPREKLIERGAQGLSEAELLAVLLGSGVRGRSAVELARHLLMEFGSLRALFSLERARFMSQRGLGPTRYCVIQAALELGRRHFREAMCIGSVLTAPEATRAFLMTQLRDRAYEVFCCLHLDLCGVAIYVEQSFELTMSPKKPAIAVNIINRVSSACFRSSTLVQRYWRESKSMRSDAPCW